MKKLVLIGVLVSLVTVISHAQESGGGWYIGLQGGYLGYYGDLQTEWIDPELTDNGLAWGASLQKPLSRRWSFRLNYLQGDFLANDRDNSRLDRSLNIQTELQSANTMFVYYPFAIRRRTNPLQPYIAAGLGYSYFKPYSNLKNSNNQLYFYWTDGTIRNMPEGSPNPENAEILTQDDTYETRLDKRNDFNNHSLTIPLSLGLDYRLTSRINLSAELLISYHLSDHLDGYELGSKNDAVYYPNLSLSYRLGKKPRYTMAVQPIYQPIAEGSEVTEASPVKNIGFNKPKPEELRIAAPTELSNQPPLTQPLPQYTSAYPAPARRDTTVHIVYFPQLTPEEVRRASTLLPDSLADNATLRTLPKPNSISNPVQVAADDSVTRLNMYRLDSMNNQQAQVPDSLRRIEQLLKQSIARQQALDSVLRIQNKQADSLSAAQQRRVSNLSKNYQQTQDSLMEARRRLAEIEQRQARLKNSPTNSTRDTVVVRQEIRQLNDNQLEAERQRLEAQMQRLEKRIDELNRRESRAPVRYDARPTQVIDRSTPVVVPYPVSPAQPTRNNEISDSVKVQLNKLQSQVDSLQKLVAAPARRDTVRVEQTVTQIDTLLAEAEIITQSTVYFASGSSKPSAEGLAEIEKFRNSLPQNGKYTIELQGYSDPSGQPAANQQLSLRRAESIKQKLIEAGVPENKIEVNYYGADPNLPRERYAYGRRVELVLKRVP
jgi:outer membrane protein OmpA-like peptidoglycan-associated protein